MKKKNYLLVLLLIILAAAVSCDVDRPDPIIPPTGLTVIDSTSSSITLTWTSVPGAIMYKIYNAETSNSGNYRFLDETENSSCTIYDLAPNSVHYFKVSALDVTGLESRKSVYAKGTAVERFTLTIIAEGGSVNISSDSQRFEPGTQVTVTAIPDSNYGFGNWTGIPSGINASNAAITLTMNSDMVLTALFIPYVTLTINAEGGRVTRSPIGSSYLQGTEVTLTAAPNNMYAFEGWIDAPEGIDASSPEIKVIVNKDMVLTAKFRALEEKKHPEPFSSDGPYRFIDCPEVIADKIIGDITVEIYAAGAGGGGAGGHWRQGGITAPDYYSTGGAGGGGAVVYRQVKISLNTTFDVTIGAGGPEGAGRKKDYFGGLGHPDVGDSGGPGGNTIVTWDGGTLSAEGGKGGVALTGGLGGIGSGNITSGKQGSNGYTNSGKGNYTAVSTGGAGGVYTGGNYSISGGSGGYGGNGSEPPQAGSQGGQGSVLLVFTWYE